MEENSYFLNFDRTSLSDEFNQSHLGTQWKWIRENSNNHSLSSNPGSLTITTEKGDVSEQSNNARNLLLQSANNDWTIDTKLFGSRAPSQPENAGIIAWQDDHNFVKLMHRAVIKTTRNRGPQPGTIDLLVEENDIAKSVATFDLNEMITNERPLYLRLTKDGARYTAYYSFNGESFHLLGSADAMLRDIKVGLIACDGIITQSMTSTFCLIPILRSRTRPLMSLSIIFTSVIQGLLMTKQEKRHYNVKQKPMRLNIPILFFMLLWLVTIEPATSQNPIIQTLYTADPAPMVWNNRLYLYTTHDADGSTWFTMDDWRLYSTNDMVNWTDHGVVLSYTDFEWAKGDAWAPQCIEEMANFTCTYP
jgi:hypothetical protein